MIYIAHRGNHVGPSPEYENNPAYLENTLKIFPVEVDVWKSDRGSYWLGHDGPQYQVNLGFLVNGRVWCHAKDVATFMDLAQHSKIQAFYQEQDYVSLTTNGYFWHHSTLPKYGPKSIVVSLNSRGVKMAPRPYAVCSDWCYRSSSPNGIKPKLILLDVDGVMTDGTKAYNRLGGAEYKMFCDKDYTAIKRFQSAGVQVMFISGDTFNSQMAFTRGVPFIHVVAGTDKKELLDRICDDQQITPQEIVFVGDDYYDLMLLESVGYAYCPQDAIADVRAVAKVLPEYGGQGVVAALWDEIGSLFPQVYPVDSPAVNP